MEELLRRLIAFKSITGDIQTTSEILGFIASYLEERGMYITYYERNGFQSLVATTTPQQLRPVVLLVAHCDVVPAVEPLFTLRRANGKYFGRGALDMKFAIASFLQLVDDLQDNLHNYDFGIMITSDEEVGGENGIKYLVNDIGYRSNVCIIPDGGMNWEIEEFAKGVYWIELTASGISAHASRPWEGDHAIHKLLAAITALRELFPYATGAHDTFLSIGTIKGGEAANQSARSASAMLDIRTGSLAVHKKVFAQITAVARKYDVEATDVASSIPSTNAPSNPYISCFHKLISEVTGQEYTSSFSFGTTDGRFFSAVNVPCVIVQPPGGDHHGNDEWLSVEGFQQFYEVLRRYISSVAYVGEHSAETPATPRALPQQK